VKDFRKVREELGTWQDIHNLADNYRLVFDAVINHVSASSIYMDKYCRGEAEYADFFIELPPDTDTSSVMRTRNTPLLHEYQTVHGQKWLWTTFSRDQVDLNFANPIVLLEIISVLLYYVENGASVLRLDAVPYLWKEPGTRCIHLPQTHEIIKLFRDILDAVAPHVLLLAEANVPHTENISYTGNNGDEAQIIYNFTLPPLILWTIIQQDASILMEWSAKNLVLFEHATYLNITATHDGIGMRPTEGLLSEDARTKLVRLAREHNGDVTGKINSDGTLSPYELNLNYFDAVNNPNAVEPIELQINRFILSQAMTFCLAGIPGLYIHSLVGSRNYTEGVKRTGRARTINREQLMLSRLEHELAVDSLRRRVFKKLTQLLIKRASCSAFHPSAEQRILELGSNFFVVHRRNQTTRDEVIALHNVTDTYRTVSVSGIGIKKGCTDIITGETFDDIISVGPYAFRWLVW
jgi:sucrose phosphorylase